MFFSRVGYSGSSRVMIRMSFCAHSCMIWPTSRLRILRARCFSASESPGQLPSRIAQASSSAESKCSRSSVVLRLYGHITSRSHSQTSIVEGFIVSLLLV